MIVAHVWSGLFLRYCGHLEDILVSGFLLIHDLLVEASGRIFREQVCAYACLVNNDSSLSNRGSSRYLKYFHTLDLEK